MARSPDPSPAMPAAISIWGKPLAACQARFGAQISSAMAGALQAHGLRNDVPAPGEHHARDQPRAEEQHDVLVLEGHPGDDADGEPEPGIRAGEQADQEPQDERPGEQVVGGGEVEVADREEP